MPWGIAADPLTGTVYVADRTGHRVAVFDGDGVFLRTFGREGQGPGEFRSPSAVTIDPRGGLTVWDTGRGVLSRWSPEGALLDEQRPPITYWGPGFAFDDGDGSVVTVAITSEEEGMLLRQQLVAADASGKEVLHELEQRLVRASLPCGTMPMPPIFAPSIVWAEQGGRVFVARGFDYAIDVLEGETTTIRIRRDVGAVETTPAMALEAVENGPGPYRAFMRRCPMSRERLVDAVGFEPEVSPIMGIAVDPADRLWVARTSSGIGPDAIDVFESGGRYLGTFQAPGLPTAFVTPGRFVAVYLEETGELRISLFEMGELDG